MNKKIIIALIIIIVIILVLVFGFLFMQKNPSSNINQNKDTENAGSQLTTKPETKAFDKGNPFTVDVNPMDGYKNPFAK